MVDCQYLTNYCNLWYAIFGYAVFLDTKGGVLPTEKSRIWRNTHYWLVLDWQSSISYFVSKNIKKERYK